MVDIPCGKLTQRWKNRPFLMGKSTISMCHFQQLCNKLPEGIGHDIWFVTNQLLYVLFNRQTYNWDYRWLPPSSDVCWLKKNNNKHNYTINLYGLYPIIIPQFIFSSYNYHKPQLYYIAIHQLSYTQGHRALCIAHFEDESRLCRRLMWMRRGAKALLIDDSMGFGMAFHHHFTIIHFSF